MESSRPTSVSWRAAAQTAFLCLALVGVTLAVFWPATRCGFTNYDDPAYFSENDHVLAGLSWANVEWAFQVTDNASWYPVTWLSYLLDATVFGKGPRGPHLTNLLLHAANTLLLFLFLRRLTGALWKSALVAALFSLHPLHVESVAWIAERKGVLSTFFGFLALWAYGRFAECRNREAASRFTFHASLFYLLSLSYFALGLMSKPSLVPLPFALLLLDYWPLRRLELQTPDSRPKTLYSVLLEKVPFFVLVALSSAATVWAHKQVGAITALAVLPLQDRIANALVSYARYLGKMVWPAHLALPYPHPWHWSLGWVVLAAALVGGLSLAAVLLARKRPYVFVGWFWFLGMLVPVIGVVQWGLHAMADRFTYMPLIGLFIIVAWAVGELVEGGRTPGGVTAAGALLLLGACALQTRHQLGYWQNSELLFRHAVAVTEHNVVALNNLGVALFDQGRVEEAINYYERAVRVEPGHFEEDAGVGGEQSKHSYGASVVNPIHVDALFNMGNALAKRGDFAKAAEYFAAVLRIEPKEHQALNNLANSLLKLGKPAEAITNYVRALSLKPNDAKAHKGLAAALTAQGKVEEAIGHYRQALAEEPNDADTHYALGIALAVRGTWDEAIGQYMEALRLGPNNPEAEYNLGYALRVQKRLREAAAHLKEALRLKPEFALAHYNLGCVLAEEGWKDEAAAHLREALRLKPDYEEAGKELQRLGAQPEKENGK
jgi:protein O-mannosyl-transferase